jgi:hypothetical protein
MKTHSCFERKPRSHFCFGLLSLMTAAFFVLSGCAAFVHRRVPADRFNYNEALSELVFKSLEKTSKQRLIELLLAEEAMAIFLVNLYERILVELDYARSMRYKYRIQFLKYHLTNFEQGLLLNPRMLFLFRNSLEHVSQKAKEYYSNKVKSLGIAGKEKDDTGPIMQALRRIEPKFSSSN